MAVVPDDWLPIEQTIEQENHTLLQTEVTETEQQQPPQLMMLLSHAAQGTSSPATFLVVIIIGGKRGLALIDSGCTYTFLDYTFASKCNCNIISSIPKKVKVAGGGYMESSVETTQAPYLIQQESFTGDFKLLQWKGYDVVLGCDWIRTHSRIGLDLRDNSRTLTIFKEGKDKIVFTDFTAPPPKPVINASKLQKLCKYDIIGFVIQINLMHLEQHTRPSPPVPIELSALL
jgi:hypothetical protein